jgi:hypothetical protein
MSNELESAGAIMLVVIEVTVVNLELQKVELLEPRPMVLRLPTEATTRPRPSRQVRRTRSRGLSEDRVLGHVACT